MRKRGIFIALLVASAYPFAAHAATPSEWQGSYAANGQCFCSGDVASTIASRIVPTPIGGQTVEQVCLMIGNGPGLTKENGLYNYPVFKDPQCGNGPFANAGGPRDVNCVGSLDGTYSSCQPAGPLWALAQAYDIDTPGSPAAALPEGGSAKSLADRLVEKASTTVAGITESTVKTSASRNDNISASESSEGGLTGESVMLDGVRYYRARTGLPAEGGAPGSRIVLDGLVYLKDDGSLAQTDLYSEEESQIQSVVPEEPELAVVESTRPVPSPAVVAPVEKPKPVRSVAPRPDPERAARLKRERDEREAKTLARLQFEEKMREARLAEQKKLAEPEKPVEQEPETVTGQRDLREKFAVTIDQDESAPVPAQVDEPSLEDKNTSANVASSSAVLQLPPDTRASSSNFNYMEAMPLNYDIGGGGLMLEGSGDVRNRYQFLGRIGVSDTYNEFLLGAGYYVTPAKATRLTVVLLAGIEHGSFELRDETIAPELTVTASDSGVFLSALTRFVVNSRFELKTGIGYSSFFEGDAILFGGVYFHVTPRLDIMSRFELGDNDSLGIGIRYYY